MVGTRQQRAEACGRANPWRRIGQPAGMKNGGLRTGLPAAGRGDLDLSWMHTSGQRHTREHILSATGDSDRFGLLQELRSLAHPNASTCAVDPSTQ
jgi:hypothetical protein